MSASPPLESLHTVYTLLPDASIRGSNESPSLLLKFFVDPNDMAYAADGSMGFEMAITMVLESSSIASGIISIFAWFFLRNICSGDCRDKEGYGRCLVW